MNTITNLPKPRDTTRGQTPGDPPGVCGRPGRFQHLLSSARRPAAWLWLLLLVAALAAYGCGGGDESDEGGGTSDEGAAAEESGADYEARMAAAGGPPQAAQPKEEKEAEEEAPLPEDVAEWERDHYYQAKKEGDPRLIEAVAYLGEHFAGTENAESAAQLLTDLLKKSEEPEPKPKTRRGPGSGYGYGYGAEMGPPPTMSGDTMYSKDEESTEAEEEDHSEMYPEGYEEDGGYGPGYPGGYPGGPGYGMPGYGRQQPRGVSTNLIRAIVYALGANDTRTAWQTITQVIEGTFETDNNRVATIAALEALVAYLSTDNQGLLLRCLTAPQELRELAGAGQIRRPGGMPYSGDYGAMGPGYGPGRGQGRGERLTAEELQQTAFSLVKPAATEDLRTKLASHLANPNTPQEDVDLFGDFLRELHPDNLAGQLILYQGQAVSEESKAAIEENFLTYSSDALAGILGIPVDKTKREQSRRRRGRRGYGPAGYGPGYMESEDHSEDYEESMEEDHSEEPSGYSMPSTMDYGYEDQGRPGRYGPMRSPSPTGRPSRYDTRPGEPSGRPSRYGGGQPEVTVKAPEIKKVEPDLQNPDLPYRLARKMWEPQMVQFVESRLHQVESLQGSAEHILLASTMPVDSVRSTLHAVLQEHWEEGPRALESAGLLDIVVSDPGLLAVIKMLPRKEAKEEARPPGRRPTRGSYGRGRPTRRPTGRPAGPGRMGPGYSEEYEGGPEEMMGPGPPRAGAGRPAEDPAQAWMFTSEDLLRVLCERLLAAARIRGGASGEGLPLELHPDATVVAGYHVDWPAADQEKLSGVPLGAMKLHYVRLEQQARPRVVTGYYGRKLPYPETRKVEDGTWMESFRNVPDSDWKRSIDLLITARGVSGEEVDENEELPMTVDVLCIDIKDPSPQAEGN